jgi:RimJ/RimL family protein N-acetyltransferase
MYKYENIGFRPIDEKDLERLRCFHNSNDTTLFLGKAELFSSVEQLKWWESMSLSYHNRSYCIVKDTYENIIGMFRNNNIDHINKNCEIGIDLLPEFRSKGYGYLSYRMVLEYLFLHVGMNSIYLRFIAFNENAQALYEKLGFEKTGFFPEFIFRHGKYWDYVLMSMTAKKFKELYPVLNNA